MDRNGTLDVIGVATTADQVAVAFNNNGTGIGWSYETLDAAFDGARWTVTGDIDRDGDLDVVAAASDSGEISWWSRDGGGGTWTAHPIVVVTGACVSETADMDRDGDLDVIGAPSGAAITWWENDGDGGTWTAHTVGDPAGAIAASYAVDLDRDGDDDLVISSLDRVQWYPNDLETSGLFGVEIVVASGLTDPRSVAVGDVDGDGDVDIASVDQATGAVLWWANTTGSGSVWGPATVVAPNLPEPQEVALADLDADGDLDAVVAAEDSGLDVKWLGWFENTAGDGSTWASHEMAENVYRIHSLTVADLDGDGDPDVAQSDRAFSEVQLWRNRGGQAALVTGPLAPPTLDPLTLAAVLQIKASHRGRSGDGDGEIASLDLLLTDGVGTPLADADADALLLGVYIFEDDDDSGTFDPDFDTQVAMVDTFGLADGVLTVTLPDGLDNLRIAPGLSRTLFVAVALEPEAGHLAPTGIEVTHLTGASVVEDRDHDLPLTLEWRPEVASGVVVPTDADLLFRDGFESGNTAAWSDIVP